MRALQSETEVHNLDFPCMRADAQCSEVEVAAAAAAGRWQVQARAPPWAERGLGADCAAGRARVQAVEALKKLNVPYLVSLPLVFQTTEEWLESELGGHRLQAAGRCSCTVHKTLQ